MMRILIATHNPGKQREYRQLLAPLSSATTLCFPQQMGLALDVPENGDTFYHNALVKAVAYAQASHLWTLADDSGLEVDALDGEPGVRSARYAGEGATDAQRYQLLLRNLEGVPWEKRAARFCCVIVLAQPSGQTYSAEGACEGAITFAPKGNHGFGYDPVFYLPECQKTMAELPEDVKNRIGHRGRAVEALLPLVGPLLRAQSAPPQVA